jgi:hypothetical protein
MLLTVLVLTVALLAAFRWAQASPQATLDPVKVAPDTHKLVFDNQKGVGARFGKGVGFHTQPLKLWAV